MKFIKAYCPACKKETLHTVKSKNSYGDSGIERIFFSIFTLGFSELDAYKVIKCKDCGNKQVIHKNSED